MSPTEIEESKRELLEKLDPQFLEIMKKRAAAAKISTSNGFNFDFNSKALAQVGLLTSEDKIPSRELSAPTTLAQEVPLPQKIPIKSLEQLKLDWTTNVDDLIEESSRQLQDKGDPKVASMRFDLHGLLLDSSVMNTPTHTGLYHHGDDPDKPGYTIQEILFLTRSTIPSQRSMSLSILSNIIKHIKSNDSIVISWSLCDEIEHWLFQLNVLLYIRGGLNDLNGTVFNSALDALVSFLNASPEYESCWDKLLLTQHGNRSFAIGVDCTIGFRCRALGLPAFSVKDDDPEPINSLQRVISAMRRDVIHGLLSTGIIDQFVTTLNGDKISYLQSERMLRILIRLARYSAQTSTDILFHPNFIIMIQTKFLAVQWPSPTPSHPPHNLAIKLLRIISQSSIKNAQKIADSSLVDCAMRFLTITPTQAPSLSTSTIYTLHSEVYALLISLFSYKLANRIAQDYQPLYTQNLRDAFINADAESATLLLRMLIKLKSSFPTIISLDSYVSHSLDAYSTSLSTPLQTACIDLFNLYATSTPSALFATRLHEKLGSWTSSPETLAIVSILNNITRPTKIYRRPHFLEPASLGIANRARLTTSASLLSVTIPSDLLRSLVTLTSTLSHINPLWSITLATLHESPLPSLINRGQDAGYWGFYFGIERSDFLRIFGSGWTYLVLAYLECVGALTPLNTPTILKNRQTLAPHLHHLIPNLQMTALGTLLDLLPGDECQAYALLHTTILGRSWMQASLDISQDKIPAWSVLKDFYDLNLWDSKTISQSSTFWGLTDEGAPQLPYLLQDLSASRQKEEGQLGLPVPTSFLFSPLHILSDQTSLPQTSRLQSTDSSITDTHLISALFDFILSLEKTLGGYDFSGQRFGRSPLLLANNLPMSSSANKIVSLMSLYTLSDDVYLDSHISTTVSSLLDKYLLYPPSPHTTPPAALNRQFAYLLEQSSFSQIKFYNSYTTLLRTYASTSYGNAPFTSLILLPLTMGFASDYRQQFYSTLLELLRVSRPIPPTLPHGTLWFFQPPEDNVGVLSLYVRGLVGNFLHGFLQNVATHHLAQYLTAPIQYLTSANPVTAQDILQDHTLKRNILRSLVQHKAVYEAVISSGEFGDGFASEKECERRKAVVREILG